MNSWESLDQQKNMLIRRSMGDKNFIIFEINELCISAGITCDEPCEAVPEVKEEEGEYPCILDMDQRQKFVLELKDEMAWSHGDKQKRTLAYLDNSVADREGKTSVMKQEETILSQRGDQYLNEFVVAKLANEDKWNISNLIKYDEELEILKDWLINPRIDNDDCLILDDSIGKA